MDESGKGKMVKKQNKGVCLGLENGQKTYLRVKCS